MFEEHVMMQTLIAGWLAMNEHQLVRVAGSTEEADAVIDDLEPDSLDVALVAANFGGSPAETARLAQRLREKLGDVAIIGLSFLDDPIEGVEPNISKANPEKIIDYINQL